MRVSDLRPRERASEPSHNVLASTSLPQREFMEATFKATWEKSIKFNALLARPKRFELLTPRFVVWCSIGRVLDSRLIPEDGSPPRNETMRHEPDRHSPALDFER